MIPASFDYHAPGTLPEALALLSKYGDDAKVLSGGQSLLPAPEASSGPDRAPDRHRAHPGPGVHPRGGRVPPHRRADPGVRARGVRGHPEPLPDPPRHGEGHRRSAGAEHGHHRRNLAHGDPGNDHPATMLALGAQVVATGPKGERVIPVEQFFLGLFRTALRPDEVLTEIRIPVPPARSGGAYLKLERKVGDYATAAAAAQVTLGERRSGRAGRPRADERGADAGQGRGRREVPGREDARRGRRWARPRSERRRRPLRAPTGVGPSSTSGRWRGSLRRAP